MKAATKMASRSNTKAVRFQNGDFVIIRVPRIDRTSTDMPRIPCIIVEVHGKVQLSYRLRYVELLHMTAIATYTVASYVF